MEETKTENVAPETCDACEDHDSSFTIKILPLLILAGIGIGVLALVSAVAFAPGIAQASTPQTPGSIAAASQPIVAAQAPAGGENLQVVKLHAANIAFSPSNIQVKSGVPVRIDFSAEQSAGCGRLVVFPEFNVRLQAPSDGSTVSATFTPTKPGTYSFRCPMNMVRGTLTVL